MLAKNLEAFGLRGQLRKYHVTVSERGKEPNPASTIKSQRVQGRDSLVVDQVSHTVTCAKQPSDFELLEAHSPAIFEVARSQAQRDEQAQSVQRDALKRGRAQEDQTPCMYPCSSNNS